MNIPKQSSSRVGARLAVLLVSASALVVAIILGASSIGCATPPPRRSYTPPTPIRADVPPIRNTAIKVIINYKLMYTPRDANSIQDNFPTLVLDRLNQDGAADGNTFTIANGEAENFTFEYVIYNNNERFTGNINMYGWGWGFIHYFDSGQYAFSNGPDTVMALTDKVYSMINTGWHDARKDQ